MSSPYELCNGDLTISIMTLLILCLTALLTFFYQHLYRCFNKCYFLTQRLSYKIEGTERMISDNENEILW